MIDLLTMKRALSTILVLLCLLLSLSAEEAYLVTMVHDDMITIEMELPDGKQITFLVNHRKADEIPTIIFKNYTDVSSFSNTLVKISNSRSKTAFIGECSTVDKNFSIKDYKVIPQEFLDDRKDHRKAWKASYKEMDKLLKSALKEKELELVIENPKSRTKDTISLELEASSAKEALKAWNRFKDTFYE